MFLGYLGGQKRWKSYFATLHKFVIFVDFTCFESTSHFIKDSSYSSSLGLEDDFMFFLENLSPPMLIWILCIKDINKYTQDVPNLELMCQLSLYLLLRSLYHVNMLMSLLLLLILNLFLMLLLLTINENKVALYIYYIIVSRYLSFLSPLHIPTRTTYPTHTSITMMLYDISLQPKLGVRLHWSRHHVHPCPLLTTVLQFYLIIHLNNIKWIILYHLLMETK